MLHVRISTTDTGGPAGLDPLDLRATLDDVASTWTTEIRDRTRSGRGADGRAMRPRRDGSRSTLHDTGAMLASLRPQTVTDSGFVLGLTGRRNNTVGAIHQATGRRWAGASPDQIEDARRAVVDALQGTRS